jgi:hypothetical protein
MSRVRPVTAQALDFLGPLVCGWLRDALQAAAEMGNLPLVKLLLRFNANVNGPPSRKFGVTALHISYFRGYIEIVKLLISEGADINAAGGACDGRTALEGAAEAGRLDIVCLLLESGCLVHGSYRNQYIRAVEFARAKGNVVLARELQKLGKWSHQDEQILDEMNSSDSPSEITDEEGLTSEEGNISDIEWSDIDDVETLRCIPDKYCTDCSLGSDMEDAGNISDAGSHDGNHDKDWLSRDYESRIDRGTVLEPDIDYNFLEHGVGLELTGVNESTDDMMMYDADQEEF